MIPSRITPVLAKEGRNVSPGLVDPAKSTTREWVPVSSMVWVKEYMPSWGPAGVPIVAVTVDATIEPSMLSSMVSPFNGMFVSDLCNTPAMSKG